ncbi:Rv3235 family protein [Arsenicicoccus dermatophilus]|uniref:Rv3235 family protein n=1 Tax=Arsenicicoccus dermatophilus TaxID=1076331 RepID=UPI0039173E78
MSLAAAPRPYVRPAPRIVPEPVGHPSSPDDGHHGWTVGQGTLDLDFRHRDAAFGPQPTASADLPPASAWAQQVSQAVVEVLAAHRPISQLVRWTTTEVYARLARGAQLAPTRHPGRGRRPVVRRVRVAEPRDGVAEVAAVVMIGDRARALAFRMVGRDGRWVIDAMTVG